MARSYNMVIGRPVSKATVVANVFNGFATSVTATKLTGRLPDGYTELEWISSTGEEWTGAYIDTGYQPVSSCKLFGKVQLLRTSGYPRFFIAEKYDNPKAAIATNVVNNKLAYYNGANYSDSSAVSVGDVISVSTGVDYSYSTSGRSITVNGTTKSVSGGSAVTSPTVNMYIAWPGTKTYYFQMTDSGGSTLVRDMVPAKRQTDGEVGMYDLVNNVFYGSANSNTFTAGPEVWTPDPTSTIDFTSRSRLPAEYTAIEYLTFSGNNSNDSGQYINTGVVPSSTKSFFLDANITNGATGASNGSAGKTIFNYREATPKVYWNDDSNIYTYLKVGRTKWVIDYYRHQVGYNTTLTTVDNPSGYSTVNFYLGAWFENGTAYYRITGKVYGLRIEDNGETIRDMVPARRNSDSVLGMYDLVNSVFYTNAGTGTFGAGPDSTGPDWVASIESGTWNIVATDGTHSSSENIFIDEAEVYGASLSFAELPDGYTQLEWVASYGAFINTGYSAVSSCRLFGKMQSTRGSSETNYWDGWFYQDDGGGSAGTNRKLIDLEFSYNGFNYYNGTGNAFPSVALTRNVSSIYTYSTSGRSITINSEIKTVTVGSTFSSTSKTLSICGRTKTWYFAMTASDALTFVRFYIPVKRDSDSVVGMYDIINSQFYTSQNSNAFTAGPAV